MIRASLYQRIVLVQGRHELLDGRRYPVAREEHLGLQPAEEAFAFSVVWRAALSRHRAHQLRVNEAPADLAQAEPRLATVVELRYFGGMTETEVAAALGLSLRTVQRDWAKARLYLSMALK